jgi:hypothetical protein
MRPGKIALAVVGALVALIAVGLIAGGGGLLWAYGTQRSADGFFTSPEVTLSTDGYALTSTEIDLGSRPGDWFPSGRLATVRLEVDSQDTAPVFVGIGPDTDVDSYLGGVEYSEVARIGPDPAHVTYRSVAGEAPSTPPSEQAFWAASTEGSGPQTLTWELEQGEWTVVIMNADTSPGVTVDAAAGARTELMVPVSAFLLVGGLVFAAIAAVLLVVAVRRPGEAVPVAAVAIAGGFGHYPVRVEGQLDPNLSRWQWLVKWLLAIPHYIVLFFLWIGAIIAIIIAWFAILFTGRYPRGLFEYVVNVMRWSLRVIAYAFVLTTDRYPPFRLGQ